MRRLLSGALLLGLWLNGAAAESPAPAGPSPAHSPDDDSSDADKVRGLKPGESATVGPITVTRNQKDAGHPDDRGQYRAMSVGGRFSAFFPAPFTDTTMTTSSPNGKSVLKIYILNSSSNGIRLDLVCFERTIPYPPDAVETETDRLRRSSVKFERKPFSLGSLQGLDVRGVNKDGKDYAGRIFMSQGFLCHFTADFPHQDGNEIPAVVRSSFDSFQPGAAPPAR